MEIGKRRGPFGLLTNTTGAPAPPAGVRRESVKFLQALKDLKQPPCRGVAVVQNSGMVRAAITAISWFVDDSIPIKTFASTADAEAWIQAMCSAADENA